VARPPNYRQDKKRREDAQKKRNQEEQMARAARKAAQRQGETAPKPEPSSNTPKPSDD